VVCDPVRCTLHCGAVPSRQGKLKYCWQQWGEEVRSSCTRSATCTGLGWAEVGVADYLARALHTVPLHKHSGTSVGVTLRWQAWGYQSYMQAGCVRAPFVEFPLTLDIGPADQHYTVICSGTDVALRQSVTSMRPRPTTDRLGTELRALAQAVPATPESLLEHGGFSSQRKRAQTGRATCSPDTWCLVKHSWSSLYRLLCIQGRCDEQANVSLVKLIAECAGQAYQTCQASA